MLQTSPGVYAMKTSTSGFSETNNHIADADHDYILYKIDRQDHIEYERQINIDDR